MSGERIIQALLVDPSLFTAPYYAALTQGLLAAGVEVTWATRPTRRGDRQETPIERVDAEDGFHIFGVDSTEKAVRHYVDGVLVVDRAFEWKHDDAPWRTGTCPRQSRGRREVAWAAGGCESVPGQA